MQKLQQHKCTTTKCAYIYMRITLCFSKHIYFHTIFAIAALSWSHCSQCNLMSRHTTPHFHVVQPVDYCLVFDLLCYSLAGCVMCCSLAGVNRPKQRRRSAGSAASVGGEMGRYVRGMQVIDSKQLRLVRSQIASSSSRRWLGLNQVCSSLMQPVDSQI